MPAARTYPDRCPGVRLPWAAADGGIVRLRVPGGRTTLDTLVALHRLAVEHGDGTVLLTARANVQLRGIALADGTVPAALVDGLRGAGLLPSDSHERVRNILCSPLTGRRGGRADLRPVVHALDLAVMAEPVLAGLGGRFLFVLDDGRGDVGARALDLGLLATGADQTRLRVGRTAWGPVVPLAQAPAALTALAVAFCTARGRGDSAWWHVDELPRPEDLLSQAGLEAVPVVTEDALPHEPALMPGRQRQDDGRSLVVVEVPDGLVRASTIEHLTGLGARELVVTPWRSIVAVDLTDPESELPE